MSRDEINERLDAYHSPSVEIPDGIDSADFLAEFFGASDFPETRHSGTCWFHATRTLNPDSFRKGILNLSRSIDLVWDSLWPLVSDKLSLGDWNDFRYATVQSGYGYPEAWRTKLKEQGPCGTMFMEKTWNTSIGYHRYMDIPELVDHILECFRYKWPSIDLRKIYLDKAKPYVIKFRVWEPCSSQIGCALEFLYLKRHGKGIREYNWPDYVGDGTTIPPDDVLKIASYEEIVADVVGQLKRDRPELFDSSLEGI